MLIFMFLSLPLALKWPKQALWMKDTSLGQVGAVSRQPCQPDDSVCVPNMPDVAERTCMQDRQKLVSHVLPTLVFSQQHVLLVRSAHRMKGCQIYSFGSSSSCGSHTVGDSRF